MVACAFLCMMFGGLSCKKSSSCPQGLAICSGQCTSTQFDPANCGACGTACPSGQACLNGACSSATCMSGLAPCDGACTDLMKDASHCGTCGTACPAGQLCSAGKCASGCTGGTSACPTSGTPAYCANFQTDPQNCGGCGTKCPQAGQSCVAGQCKCGFAALSVANSYSCALKTDGSVVCWGVLQNYDSSSLQSLQPTVIAGLGSVKSLVGGNRFMCALKTDGTVWCWGYASDGELGNNATAFSATPVQVMDSPTTMLSGVAQIAPGTNHVCALKSNGEVWCWGQNDEGQLGTGSSGASSLVAVQATAVAAIGATITAVAAGSRFGCALTSAGAVYCWGDNQESETGNGNTTSPQLTPVLVAGVTASEIALGFNHACALKSDHSLWCWGRNNDGETGDGNTTTPVSAPTQVLAAAATPLANVAHVVAGQQSTCALKTDGTVWCWGANDHAQLGNNLANGGAGSSYPVQVMLTAGSTPTYLKSVTQLVLFDRHPCALIGDQGYCWGSNHHAQVDIGPFDLPVATATTCGP